MQSVWKGWLVAGAAVFLWIALVVAWWMSMGVGADGMGGTALFALLAALVPSLLIGLLALVIQRLETARLQVATLEQSVRAMPAPHSLPTAPVPAAVPAAAPAGLTRPEIDAMFQKLAARQQVSDRALLSLLEGRAADRTVLAQVAENSARAARAKPAPRVAPPSKREAGQPSLPLNEPQPDEQMPPSWADMIRALNFPQDQNDDSGFRAMHRAMRDRQMAQVLRAAEDVLNLLSQDGIYMDDLDPVQVETALWRRFADGQRGAEMSGLAAINDHTALTLTRGRMRSDDVMRDAALHFIRHFDLLLKTLCARMDDDEEIARLADTRTGRAFMLLATVTGALD